MRKGLRDNPTKRHLEALADFFGVSPAYFFDDAKAERIDMLLTRLAALRDADRRRLAARVIGLSQSSIEVLGEMIDHLRELEGLPAAAGDQAMSGEDDPPAGGT